MKYYKFILVAATVLAVLSCVREEENGNEPQDKDLIEMSFEASFADQTKAEIGEKGENGYAVLWSPGDAISVFPVNDGQSSGGYRFVSANEEPAAYATFTGQAPADEAYYAVYPYSNQHQWSAAEGKLCLRSSNIRYANGLGGRSYMLAEANDGLLSFKHIYGYVKFTVPESVTDLTEMEIITSGAALDARFVDFYPETMAIGELVAPASSLILIPYNDEKYIKPGTYYMAVLPGILPQGFSLRFYNDDGLRFVKATAKSVEIERGKILNLGEISDLCFDYPISTCEEVYNAGVEGNDGRYYRMRGMVSSVANTEYGNWYITDETGYHIYIYGTVDEDGVYYGSERFDLAIGDTVTVQGPIKNYNGVIELVDASIVEHKKSLVRVDPAVRNGIKVPSEGDVISVSLTVKGDGLEVFIPEDATSWLSIVNSEISGEDAIVVFNVSENSGSGRLAEVWFKTEKDGCAYYAILSIEQESAVLDATADEIYNAADGLQIYRLTGYVSSIANTKYGNLYIKDYSGDIYVYGTYDVDGNRFDAFNTPVNEGDIITVEGRREVYNSIPQLRNVKVVQHYPVTDVTVQEFIKSPAAGDVYYRLTGKMENILMTSDGKQNPYGNFDINDGTASVYVYGLLAGWGGPRRDFLSLELIEGDVVTLVGVRDEYKGTPQVGKAFYVKHDRF